MGGAVGGGGGGGGAAAAAGSQNDPGRWESLGEMWTFWRVSRAKYEHPRAGEMQGTLPRRIDPLLQCLTTPRPPLGLLGQPLCNLWEGKGKERGVGSGSHLRIPAPSAGRRLQQQTLGPGWGVPQV